MTTAPRPTVAYCHSVGCLHLAARVLEYGQIQAYCKLSGRPPAKMLDCPNPGGKS